jgi:hypothetical protein
MCLLGENVTFIPLIAEHLNTLHKKFGEYFKTYGEDRYWIRDPLSVSAIEASLPLNTRKELVTLRADRAFTAKFAEMPLDTFWLSLKSDTPYCYELRKNAHSLFNYVSM